METALIGVAEKKEREKKGDKDDSRQSTSYTYRCGGCVYLCIGTYMPIKYIVWTAAAMVWCNMVAMCARHK